MVMADQYQPILSSPYHLVLFLWEVIMVEHVFWRKQVSRSLGLGLYLGMGFVDPVTKYHLGHQHKSYIALYVPAIYSSHC